MAVPHAQQSPAAARWLDAVDAWNAGRYPDALRDLIALADSPSAREYHDRIALLTGELFTTIEITRDGRNPRVSSTGDYVAYDTGPAGAGATRVVSVRPVVREVAELPTTTAVFDPAGRRIAWIRIGQPGTMGTHAIVVRDLATGVDTAWPEDGLLKTSLVWAPAANGIVFVGAAQDNSSRTDIFLARADAAPQRLSSAPGYKVSPLVDPGGAVVVYSVASASPFGGQGPRPGRSTSDATVIDLKSGTGHAILDVVTGSLTMSADGSALAWIGAAADGALTLYMSAPLAAVPTAVRAVSGAERMASPVLSPDGTRVAYQFQSPLGSATDWEIYVSDRAGNHRRVTREIQHDVLPRFLDNRTLLGLIGEPRHRRSHVYDLDTGVRTRLFHNNTIRTISAEYVWAASADGRSLAVQADRDGDVVSPARGIYLVDRSRPVTPRELAGRLQSQLRQETELRSRMAGAYQPVSEQIRQTVSRVSTTRVYECHRAMAAFESKFMGEPGNLKAIDYLQKAYASFGYTPDVQWFSTVHGGGASAPKTANVVATLKGTANPELIYVASSHFDSIRGGTGADDNTSGTCALLETARVLSRAPLPATVLFASFTGEEGGLVGSREFVRLARSRHWQVVGALNNDMIGWSGDGARLDNTIRYSNAGIRDIQHGAAFLFTDLVLFDARYYLGTDASVLNEAWGEIVGGIGSYPILANPNYHQPTDLLETIDFRQVAETARVTAASLIAMASSPSPPRDVNAMRTGAAVEVSWAANQESGVTGYVVTYGPELGSQEKRISVKTPRATLTNVPPGARVGVKAVNARGLESWGWANTIVK
jgi:Tol biopolymer transport system component